jgi:hypothetical protein
MEPASIRYKNPGAMWGSSLARKWGAEPKAVSLNDGTGQNNTISVFPTFVQGICAQLDEPRRTSGISDLRRLSGFGPAATMSRATSNSSAIGCPGPRHDHG